ncbi:MAG: MFS transporter [Propionibacteriaceae bacterium]|jgi:EmrB/QacA subfamily drug resistance transporter|nr:MFS transporter [Propionibacteriaceae bacterium]
MSQGTAGTDGAGAIPPAADTYVPDPNRWKALWVCFAAGFVTMLDVSIVNVALPSMQAALHAGATQLQFIVAGYTLAFGLMLVPAGRLGDVRGRRTMFLIAVTCFGVTSLLAGLSQNDTMLAVLRLLQGASAGMLNPQTSGIIQSLFRGPERGKAFGLFGMVIGVSTALGPLAGGLLLAAFGSEHGWRWVFWVNVPICLAVVILGWRLLPRQHASTLKQPLDLIGVVFIALGTMCFMAPFVTTPDSGFFDDPQRWWWLAPAVVLAPLAYLWEKSYQRRTGAAVLNPVLLRDPGFVFGAALGVAYFAGFTALFLIITMVLQNGLGYTPLEAGLVGVPYAIASGFVAQLSGRLVNRWGRPVVVAGILGMLIGLVGLILLLRLAGPSHLGLWMALILIIAGAGNGAVISPNQTLTFAHVPPSLGSVAGAVLQVGQRVGSAIGVSVVLAVYFSIVASRQADLGQAAAAELAAGSALMLSAALVACAAVIAGFDAHRRHPHKAMDGHEAPLPAL